MSIDKIAAQLAGVSMQRATDSARPVARTVEKVANAEEGTPSPALEPATPKLEEIALRLESYIRSVSRSLEFKVDAASGRTVISVLDGETGDLIRQIPNEEVLRFAQMAEDQTIVLLSETA